MVGGRQCPLGTARAVGTDLTQQQSQSPRLAAQVTPEMYGAKPVLERQMHCLAFPQGIPPGLNPHRTQSARNKQPEFPLDPRFLTAAWVEAMLIKR